MQKQFKKWKMRVKVGKTNDNIFEQDVEFELSYPLTIDFNVKKAFSNYTNNAVFTIYGLSDITRGYLFKTSMTPDSKKCILIEFTAGYGDDLSVIFVGRCRESYSLKNGGATEYHTVINCDSTYPMKRQIVEGTYDVGTTLNVIVEDVFKPIYGMRIDKSLLDNLKNRDPLIKPYSFSKTPEMVLQDLTGGGFFEDDGVVYWIDKDLSKNIYTINSASGGLLTTPQMTGVSVTFSCVFEPKIRMGSVINLVSQTEPKANNVYKVMQLYNKGVISGGVESKATTQITAYNVEGLALQNVA